MEFMAVLAVLILAFFVVAPVIALVSARDAAGRVKHLEERLRSVERARDELASALRRVQGDVEELSRRAVSAEVVSAAPEVADASPAGGRAGGALVGLPFGRGPRAASEPWGDAAPVSDASLAGGAERYEAVAAAAPSQGAPSQGAPSHAAPSQGAPSHAALTDAALTDAALTDAVLTNAALTDAVLTDAVPGTLPPSAVAPAVPPEAASSGVAAPSGVAASSGVPPASSARPTPAPRPPPMPAAFDWERWVGVRGAAVVGGAVLALAAILFFRYAVEHGLIPPPVRVAIGALVGVGCVVAGERLRLRYAATANGLSGAGLVCLYAAFWAARVLYGLIGTEVAFVAMVLTTAAGCLIALRSGSLVVAVLGLVGGFSTPLLLSSGGDHPIGFFGYLLLLDTGFLLVARRRGWSVLMALALGGTLLFQAVWVVDRMGPDRAWLGIAIVALFSAVFVLAGIRPQEPRRAWFYSQAAALLIPVGFALYFASRARLGVHLAPIAMLLALLAFGAGWLGSRQPRAQLLPLGIAGGSVAVVAVWLGSTPLTTALAWEAALASAGLALVFQLRAELSTGERGSALPAAAVELGLLAVLVAFALGKEGGVSPFPWLGGWVLLAGLLAWLGRFEEWGWAVPVSAALLGVGLHALWRVHLYETGVPEPSTFFAIDVALAALYATLSLLRRRPHDRLAAYSLPVVLLGSWAVLLASAGTPLLLTLGATFALGVLAAFAATLVADGRLLLLGAFVLVAAQHATVISRTLEPGDARLTLAALSGSVLFVSLWPVLTRARLRSARWAVYTSALAGPLWFIALHRAYRVGVGPASIGVLPVALGALSLGLLGHARRSIEAQAEQRSALAWHAGVALGLLSIAIPLQLERQWITIGWALESAALLLLFRRLDHAGLKWLSLGLALVVSARLVFVPNVLAYGTRGAWPFFNWLLYTYWLPAGALLAGHLALRPIEVGRLRPWEADLYGRRHSADRRPLLPFGALGLGFAVVLIVFVWLNLAVLDAFGEGARLELDFERRPARDLALALAWACYAGVLLTLGMMQRSKGLRWLSLLLFISTIGKVFLHDLGQLQDLYQVLSLAGLALSLILVSLAYQRFVFRKAPPEEPA